MLTALKSKLFFGETRSFRFFPAGLKIWTGIYGLASILGGTRKKQKKGNYFLDEENSDGRKKGWTANAVAAAVVEE